MMLLSLTQAREARAMGDIDAQNDIPGADLAFALLDAALTLAENDPRVTHFVLDPANGAISAVHLTPEQAANIALANKAQFN